MDEPGRTISTAVASLDRLLDGGLERDALTLVFGEGGSGKTNLALQMAREAARRGLRVAYVDTEGVSPTRLRQVFEPLRQVDHGAPAGDAAGSARPANVEGSAADAAGRAGHASRTPSGGTGESFAAVDAEVAELADGHAHGRGDAVATGGAAGDGDTRSDQEAGVTFEEAGIDVVASERAGSIMAPEQAGTGAGAPATRPRPDPVDLVLFFTPYTIEEQERLVQNATRVPGLGLVVVDSINMHYRLAIDGQEGAEAEASRSLYKQLHHLTTFARREQVPVLITGQVYGGEDTTQPFARRVMEHLVKALIRFEKRPDGTRRATVLKHRSIEEGRHAVFRIGRNGLEDP